MARDPAQREVANGGEEAGSSKRGTRTAARRAPAAPDARTAIRRVIIENVKPQVDGGRFPIKRTPGEQVVVEADIFTDGHDQIACLLRYRRAGGRAWTEARMAPLGNDRWRGEFTVSELGRYEYALAAWIDAFLSWRHDFTRRKVEDEQDIALALRSGAALVAAAAQRAAGRDATQLRAIAKVLGAATPLSGRHEIALGEELLALMNAHPDRERETVFEPPLAVVVEPRACALQRVVRAVPALGGDGTEPARHVRRLRGAAAAHRGDGLRRALPAADPSHRPRQAQRAQQRARRVRRRSGQPVGDRRGARADTRRSIPSWERCDDFTQARRERAQARASRSRSTSRCSARPIIPTSRRIPNGSGGVPTAASSTPRIRPRSTRTSIRSTSTPPPGARCGRSSRASSSTGSSRASRVFRVDNPHTKPFALWEWLIGEVKRDHPEVIFLSEAFTRPRVMHRLAKLGFTQSYTYFTWRNTQGGADRVLHRAVRSDESREYFRPNAWPNTPDILTEYLQFGGRPAFMARLVLAATLAASYGIYGPAFELCENAPREPGSEEYLDSEKYEIRHRELDRPDGLRDFIARVNAVAAREPRAAPRLEPAFPRRRQRSAHLLQQGGRDRSSDVITGGRQPRPASHGSRAGSTLTLDELGDRR